MDESDKKNLGGFKKGHKINLKGNEPRKMISFRLDKDILSTAQSFAKENKITLTELVENTLSEVLEKETVKQEG